MHIRQAIIVKDMTSKQREERRARRTNRNRVENVEIEEGAPLPRNLNASNTMDTCDHHTLSPILGNGNLQNRHFQSATLSHLNINSSTRVFDDTTLVGQQSGLHPFSEETETEAATVIGGEQDQAARSTTSTVSLY